jgi:translocation and assembly module TamB
VKDANHAKRILLKILSWAGWILVSITALLLVVILLIRIPAVQNKLTQQAIAYLENKIGTEVRLEHIFISFPKNIVLQGLYLEDQSKDTLLYAEELNIDTDLWGLTQNRIELNRVELINCTAAAHRSQAGTFNFDYIMQAFAGDSLAVEDTTATAWEFSMDEVSVSKTSLSFRDLPEGNQASLKIGTFELDMDEFNLTDLLFSIKSVELKNTQAEIIQTNTTAAADTSSSKQPNMDFDEIKIQDVQLHYKNAAGQDILADLGEFNIRANEVDLENNKIDLQDLQLIGSSISFRQDRTTKQALTPIKNETFAGLNIPWNIKLNSVELTDNSLAYHDFNSETVKGSIDLNHLELFGFQFLADEIVVNGSTLQGRIKNLSFQEKSGLAIQSFEGDLKLTNRQLDLNKFILHSGRSKIDMKGSASFSSLAQYEQASVNVQLNHSIIALSDVLLFAPTLLDSLPLDLPDTTTILVSTRVTGPVNDLTIHHLDLSTLRNTILALKGNIKGLPDIDHAIMNMEVYQFHTVVSDIKSILVDSLIPTSIQLPEWVRLKGSYSGTVKSSNTKFVLTSDVGQLNAQGKITFSKIPAYDVILSTKQLHLGKILKQPETMGMIDMHASVKGSGFSMDSLNTAFQVDVAQFQYNQYDYKDFKMEGTLNNYLFSGTGSLHDENLDFVLAGDFDYQEDIPLYNFTLDLKNANFQKLNLSERPLKARGKLNIDLATSDFRIINGTMAIRKVAIFNGESLYMVDSLLFASIDQEGESSMKIQSDIISGEFTGTFNLFKMPGVMRQHINQYFALQDKSLTAFQSTQNFKFDLTLKNTDLITEILIPDLDPFIPGKISGEFNSEENKLNIEVDIAQIKYATTIVDSLSLLITSDASDLRYKFRLKNIKQDTLTIDAVQLTGKIQNDSIYSSFQILNANDEKKYVLGGVIKSQENKFRFSFLHDQIVLNYTKWSVPEDHYVDFNIHGMQTNNFAITGGQERIALITTVKDSTVSVEFKDLQLSSLTRIVRGVMPARGKLNGNLKFTTSAQGRFNSKLQIDDLKVLEQAYGNLTLALSHSGNRYAIDFQVKNGDSNLTASGFYVADEKTSEFKLSVNLSPLNLKLIEPLTYGQLKNVKGIAEGNLQVSGNFKKPVIRGDITFREASFTSTYLNNTFTLNNERISFEETGIAFNNFTIQDKKKNQAEIRGNILTEAYQDFRFNLRVNAKNFQLLNTTEKDNKLFYGNVRVNTEIRITGNQNRPRVDMTASLSKDSELTYVIPQEQKSVMEQEGIVQFVDKDAVLDPFLAAINLADTVASSFAGINISANLELTDEETLHIIIDPMTGDRLSVKGNANLTFNMTASGNMNLAGRYEIAEGSYNLSFYKLVKRKFAIEKGGTIIWSGNPFNAQLDIRARYEVETTPIDLIANQINTTDQAQLNSYRQRLPFLVLLDIKGQLLAPQITFQIDMPIDKRAAYGGIIYAKILDINTRESDVNKQVFALLILQRFVSDNPLESEAGSAVANATRTSVSRILTEQLNRLSDNIKGVQLSVDIKSYQDYSTGEAQGDTQVQLGVSKSLFNDRLVVKLSGNVDVEGENTTQEEVTDYIGDLAIEYKLTRDGRFRVTGFRTNNYDMIDGELVETGAGLIYIKDYNTLRELFKRNVKEK